jgi:phenylacetate-coenzyme A ligase PaaK-like adenylate-forming protein
MGRATASSIEDLPYLPITLFKDFQLRSVPESSVFRILNSSGTQGRPSSIYLSKENSRLQTQVLHELFRKRFGAQRLPMIIFDSKSQLQSNSVANARKAAVIGFSSFASERVFVLDDNLKPNWDLLEDTIDKFKNSKIFLFGFTFLIWQSLNIQNEGSRIINIPEGIVLHGGGWKKLQGLNISKHKFRTSVKKATGAKEIVDYYGMAEQTGSIYFECSSGFFHSTNYSTIIIRNFSTHIPVPFGKEGIVQLLSTLPISYPGHSILTQDIGIIHGEDDCKCGEVGRYFSINGRLPKSQVRGCSDV